MYVVSALLLLLYCVTKGRSHEIFMIILCIYMSNCTIHCAYNV
jgi:hypothetical protein